VADAFEEPPRTADLLLFTFVEIQNSSDVLADLVALGIERPWRRIRSRGRQVDISFGHEE